MTRDELRIEARIEAARELRAITAALADRITIVNQIIEPDGAISATYRQTVRLPRHNERKTS